MFGGGSVTAWTPDQVKALARREVYDAIRKGRSDYAKTMTRELLRLCLQDSVEDAQALVQTLRGTRSHKGLSPDGGKS